MIEKILKEFSRNFKRKNDFPSIFWKVAAKNRAFENNIIFLRQFFPFRGGGGVPSVPPNAAYGSILNMPDKI